MSRFADNSQYLACHEEILRLACQMHRAAQRSDWDRVTELQAPYVHEVDRLKDSKENLELSDSEREYRYKILSAILTEDAAIRNLLMPAFARVGEMLNSSRRRKELVHAYRMAD